MTRVVDLYPTSDDDLGNVDNRRGTNPKADALVPKVKATGSSRRIRRLKTRKCSPENPLFKTWTEEDNSLLDSTKNSVSPLGRRTTWRPNTGKRHNSAELKVPKSMATTSIAEFNNGFQRLMEHRCDSAEEIDQGIEDQLTKHIHEAEARDSEIIPNELKENSPQHDDIPDEGVYIVERILSHQGNGTRRRYFVKWQGYDATENSWVPRKDFVDRTFPQQYDARCSRAAS
jgi:hypothetical protein